VFGMLVVASAMSVWMLRVDTCGTFPTFETCESGVTFETFETFETCEKPLRSSTRLKCLQLLKLSNQLKRSDPPHT